jgi:hypothetical protein
MFCRALRDMRCVNDALKKSAVKKQFRATTFRSGGHAASERVIAATCRPPIRVATGSAATRKYLPQSVDT